MTNRTNKIAEALGRDALATSGRHHLRQTAFRLPAEQLAWLAAEAARNDTTMTALVIAAIDDYRRNH